MTIAPAQAGTPEEALASRFRAAEALIDTRLAKEAVPGAAIGVVHDQTLIWSHQYGVESLETRAPVTNDTLFSICSVSKLFTGIAAMSLVEDGRMALDAPVSGYLGGASPTDTTGAEEPVTIRNILAHVSGLPREGAADFWGDNSFPDADGLTETITAQSQLYRPYDYWQYSNLGMAMLGAAISAASGASWADYVTDTILTPLGMATTTTDMPFERAGAGFALGYYVRSGDGTRRPVEPHTFQAFDAAAGMASSVNDMAKFASWNFRLRENGGEEVLKATTLREMQRVHWVGAEFDEPAWGLAFGSTRYGDKTLWGHGGYCPGARTDFVMRLPAKIGVVMMVTANDVAPQAIVRTVYDLTESAIMAVHGKDADQDSDANDPPDKNGIDLSAYEGHYAVDNYPWDTYVGINTDGLFALSLFDANAVENIQTLSHEDGDVFRRKRKDGSLAEAVIFERDADGEVIAMVQNSYRMHKR